MQGQSSHKSRRLVFTVTNELNFDQRMIRICSSLAREGYSVLLVGRRVSGAPQLQPQAFEQKRLSCLCQKGFLFYAEFNIRLFFFLLFQRMDLICAIDLDTILPCYLVSALRKKQRVYDAHELFCEMKEVVTRPRVHRIWKRIESFCIPRFPIGYTVNQPIRDIFEKRYGVHYEVIMNVPHLRELPTVDPEPWILYQGAVNQGRSFETLIPAFQWIDMPLHIYGDGNFLHEAKALVQRYQLAEKVIFKGKVLPQVLKDVTPKALIGITIFENTGLSNYYSLANRFFDYIQAGVPQLCVNYPVYAAINKEYRVAVLVDDLSPEKLAAAIDAMISDQNLLYTLKANCLEARKHYNWQAEEKKLLLFYHKILAAG